MHAYSFLILLAVLTLYGCQNRKYNAPGEELTKEEISKYMKLGNQIAGDAGSTLSSNLKNALQEGGVEKAIPFCNLAASPLIDSLEKVWKADIKRSSFQIRNKLNYPDYDEQVTLKYFSDLHKEEKDLFPIVKPFGDDSISFYSAIIIQPLCLNCHGTPSQDIQDQDYALIKQYYPEDNAIGFNNSDLRGIWSIRFEKQ